MTLSLTSLFSGRNDLFKIQIVNLIRGLLDCQIITNIFRRNVCKSITYNVINVNIFDRVSLRKY